MTALRTPRVIKVGTDFSGLDTAVLALQRLSHLPVQLCFWSDTDKHCKKLLLHFHQPKNFYDNAEGRKKEEEVPVDLYIATPPCQPWSSQGKQLGLQDPRGQLIKVPIRYVQRHRPRLFIMENVKGMCSKKHTCFEGRPLCSTDPGVSCFCRCIERSFLFCSTRPMAPVCRRNPPRFLQAQIPVASETWQAHSFFCSGSGHAC